MVIEPRHLVIRNIAYCRNVAAGVPHTRVTRQVYNPAARRVADWDPRLAKQADSNPAIKPNLVTHYNLSGATLLTDNVDAGWRLELLNEAAITCFNWDSRANQRHIQYDSLFRPIAVTERLSECEPDTVERFTFGDSHALSAAQNRCGRLIRHDDPAGTRQITGYDLNGRVLVETRRFLKQLGSPSWPIEWPLRDQLLNEEHFNTASHYAPTGELLEQVDAMGNRHRHSYDVAGRPRQIHLKLANAPEQALLSEVRYNVDGQVQSETAGNGVINSAEFRPEDGRLLRLVSQIPANSPVQDLIYEYDPVGNIVRIEDAARETRHFKNQQTRPESTFNYDSLYQLIKATGRESCLPTEGPDLPPFQPLPPDPTQMANYVQTFEYDTGGNLVKRVHLGAQQYSRKMMTAPDSNRSLPLHEDGSEPDFVNRFDPNGNLKCLQSGPDMKWNLRNQLQEITLVSRADTTNDREIYIYDGTGQRVRKVSTTQAKNVSHVAEVLYLPGLEIRTNSARNEFLHVISLQAGRGSVRLLHWETPPPGEVENDQLRFGVNDQLGSSALELDERGRILSQEGYYPFGGTAWFAARSEVEGQYKTIRYSGKERDVSGLYYYGFRYYVAWWCRWLSPDPIGLLGGTNLYQMVGNNPIVNIDPDGRMMRGMSPPVTQGSTPPPVPPRPQSSLLNSAQILRESAEAKHKPLGLQDILNAPPISANQFEKMITQLLSTSKAEEFQSIVDYVEAGQKRPNRELRTLASSPTRKLKSDTKELVSDLLELEIMNSKFIAFRSIKTKESGFAALQEKGSLVTDLAIQSASVTRKNAEAWGSEWAKSESTASREVMILFGEHVPKINLSSGFLMDHVVVLPAEKLEVNDFKIVENKLYVLLTTPTTDNATDSVRTIFDGTTIENFQAIQQKIKNLKGFKR